MKVGIVGLPNAGKSSLLTALTSAGAATAGYPFTTVEPNVAVVPVRDDRLEQVAATVGATRVVPETIEFHDIAFEDDQLAHPDGRVDPVADAETVETELLYADLESAQRRLERVERDARSGAKELVAEEAWLREVVDVLSAGRPVRSVPVPEAAPGALRLLSPLTAKPVLYVANVGEGEALEPPERLVAYANERGARATAVSARLESELGELDPAEAEAMRSELGVPESGLVRVVREAFALLDLIAFFTADTGKEARARAIRRGTQARRAAGVVHTDMERGFVAAEVVPWQALVDAGGYAAARERALLRTEGRDYEVQDGEVVNFRFTS